jgi:hypothetical protein
MEISWFRTENTLNYKIITAENVKALAIFINELYLEKLAAYEKLMIDFEDYTAHPENYPNAKDIPKEPLQPDIIFEVLWKNNRKSSNNVEKIFGDFLSSRKPTEIKIQYYQYDELNIEINLKHSKTCTTENSIIVEGTNEIIVNGIVSQITQMTDQWKPQETWPNKYQVPLIFAISIGLSLSISEIFFSVFNFILYHRIAPEIWIVFVGSLPLMPILFVVALFIINKISSIYPCIEFSIGPDHQRYEQIKRGQLNTLIWEIVIPIIISLVFYILPLFGVGG